MTPRSWWAAAASVAAVLMLVGGIYLVASEPGGHSDRVPSAGAGQPSTPTGVAEPATPTGAGQSSTPAGAGPSSGDRGNGSAMPPIDSTPHPLTERATLRISHYEVLSPTRLRVFYEAGVPECHGRLGSTRVVESDTQVTVALNHTPPREKVPAREEAPARDGIAPQAETETACIEMLFLKSTRVDLQNPLGGRTVVDATTGKTVSREPALGDR